MVNKNLELFSHEKLDVYKVALEFLQLAQHLSRALPRSKGQLGDQITRASQGIVLCIAEGAGVAWHSAEQKRFFRSARASSMECAAVLDICRIRGTGRDDCWRTRVPAGAPVAAGESAALIAEYLG